MFTLPLEKTSRSWSQMVVLLVSLNLYSRYGQLCYGFLPIFPFVKTVGVHRHLLLRMQCHFSEFEIE